MLYDMTQDGSSARVIARLDAEELAIMRRARRVTGKSTTAVVKAALRLYGESLGADEPLEIFRRFGVVGSIEGPTDLSETYKQRVDYSGKHGTRR